MKTSLESRGATPYLFIAPFMIILIVFNLLPTFFTFIISFTNWDGFSKVSFIGFANYKRLFSVTGSYFFKALFNTAFVLMISLPVVVALALFISNVMMNKFMVFKSFFRLVSFLPYIITPVAIGILFGILFDWKYGSINSILVALKIIKEPVNWLGGVWTSRIIVAVIIIWKSLGYYIVLFLSGMTTIPVSLYEAAVIDGANPTQKFFKITLPMLKPVITFAVIIGLIQGFQLFDEPVLLFNGGFSGALPFGGPDYSVLTLVMYLYDEAFRTFNYGFGSAIAYGMFIVIAVFSFSSMKILNKDGI